VDAVAAPRMHHQWFPDKIQLERIEQPPHAAPVEALRRMGHQVDGRSTQGSAHSISVDPTSGMLTGIADYRRDGRPASIASETIALWDFGDRAGTKLDAASRLGKLESAWSGGIANSVTDGRDRFRIRRRARSQPMGASLDLTAIQSESSVIAVEVKIDAAQFRGRNPNEQLRISFTGGRHESQVTARMIFGRNGRDRITIHGHAFGGGTPIAPLSISDTGRLSRPIVVRLALDTSNQRYTIACRDASSPIFQLEGNGKLAAGRTAKSLELSAFNDFAADGEYVNIDRIELRLEGDSDSN
jgi:hypothetical protein